MSQYLSFLGPLAILVVVALMRQHLTPIWAKLFAVVTSLILVASLAADWSGLLLGQASVIFVLVTDLVAATSAWDSVQWLKEHRHIAAHRYYLWWAMFWASLLGIAVARNLAMTWLEVEFSTLASGALVVEMGNRQALEAAWKYIVIASVGLVLALIGIVFVYASLKSQQMGWATLDYRNLRLRVTHIPPIIRQVATILIVSGFGTKAGLVPFHSWLPDAHSEAPSPVSGLLSGVLLGLSLFAVARFVTAVPVAPHVFLTGDTLLTLFGTISVLVGSLALLVQRDIKRLLAYSSIEQMGIIAIALGMGSKAALAAALWQFVLHAVIKSTLFYGAGHLSVSYHTKRLEKITGLIARNQWFAILWGVGILALAGLPPFGLAYSEWLILENLWLQHALVVATLLSAALALTFAALSYHLLRTLWHPLESSRSLPDTAPEPNPQLAAGGPSPS
ncbi:MAG: proton-conducting transporter membrane subunit [Thermaerobacter sp.]|nr:proton-conducting transporter membrane subunit [Thermaerobacter sp.]